MIIFIVMMQCTFGVWIFLSDEVCISKSLDDMDAYENLTDSIVDQIMWSKDERLKKAKEILNNVKNRKLYVCLEHVLCSPKMVRISKEKWMET